MNDNRITKKVFPWDLNEDGTGWLYDFKQMILNKLRTYGKFKDSCATELHVYVKLNLNRFNRSVLAQL